MRRRHKASLVGSFVLSIVLTAGTGLIPNQPAVSIPEASYYGYPLYWLVLTGGEFDVAVGNLLLDLGVIWLISFVGALLLQRYR